MIKYYSDNIIPLCLNICDKTICRSLYTNITEATDPHPPWVLSTL
jgi:hypothetical protein